jgi:hypothetical protein
MQCTSCGDDIPASPGFYRFNGLPKCGECYAELAHGLISHAPAKLYSGGRGCPLEGRDDDASPGQETAICDMETASRFAP